MNFWTPQTGKMGDGWAYTYGAHTHPGPQADPPALAVDQRPTASSRMMPVRGTRQARRRDPRRSWYLAPSRRRRRPYYYSGLPGRPRHPAPRSPRPNAPRSCASPSPKADESGVVIDAFDRGSHIKVMPDARTDRGLHHAQQRRACPTISATGSSCASIRRKFAAVQTDRRPRRVRSPAAACSIPTAVSRRRAGHAVREGALPDPPRPAGHAHAAASSFISPEAGRAEPRGAGDRRLRDRQVQGAGALGRGAGPHRGRRAAPTDQYAHLLFVPLPFGPCFPRKFYESDRNGRDPVHYSPYNGEVLPGYMYTDTGILGHVPQPVPAAQSGLSVGQRRNPGRDWPTRLLARAASCPNGPRRATAAAWSANNSASVVADAHPQGRPRPKKRVADALRRHARGTRARTSIPRYVSSTGRLGHDVLRHGWDTCPATSKHQRERRPHARIRLRRLVYRAGGPQTG